MVLLSAHVHIVKAPREGVSRRKEGENVDRPTRTSYTSETERTHSMRQDGLGDAGLSFQRTSP